MRVMMANVYLVTARQLIFEPLSLYLERKQEKELKGTLLPSYKNPMLYVQRNMSNKEAIETGGEAKDIYQYFSESLQQDKFGCLSKLWADAVEWYATDESACPRGWFEEAGISTRPIETVNHGHPSYFLQWWVRAAQARGHAEWLIKERRESLTPGHSAPIESWRLRPPGTVGQYDNSCGPWCVWMVVYGKKREDPPGYDYDEDDFCTNFNIVSDMMRGNQAVDYGWPMHSFVYGAPVRCRFPSSLTDC